MKTSGDKKGNLDLSEILCYMCKTEDDKVSEDLSDSDADEDPVAAKKSKECIPLERRERVSGYPSKRRRITEKWIQRR